LTDFSVRRDEPLHSPKGRAALPFAAMSRELSAIVPRNK